MGQKSWAVTVVPLIIYLLSFGYSVVTGNDFTAQQSEMLQTLFYGFLGAGAIGAGKSVLGKLTKN